MKSKTKIGLLVHNFTFIILVLLWDLKIIGYSYHMMIESSMYDDIFGGTLVPFICFLIFMPLFIEELLYLKCINFIAKHSLHRVSQTCLLIAIAIAIFAFFAFQVITYTEIDGNDLDGLLKIPVPFIIPGGWMCALSSFILYLIGRSTN